ncbi:MAG: ABC transporter ATP-binding protein [Cyclobacteriaceae bacterium]|nr:MAG: ABC transporter ATP-binding protein [Cyclobacteriaceae bacterium]
MDSISVEAVSKRYRIGVAENSSSTLTEKALNSLKAPFRNYRRLRNLSRFGQDDESVFWALKEISFTVKNGEAFGIIGHNGAGKSTLLKILARITQPSSGEIRIRGKVSSLLEVGTGFHPDLTGRENIYMNGTILGMRKSEIDRKLDQIVAFSGVTKYIDTPVKRYSSGMKVRLAFSVAAHLEPDILIIDEVLAVGDAEFQRKCLGKMEDISGAGRTVLFVSHDMTAVQNLCSRAILLNKGSIELMGKASDVVNYYFNKATTGVKLSDRSERRGKGDFRFVDYGFFNHSKNTEGLVYSGDSISIELSYRITVSPEELKSPHIAISIHHHKYGLITSLSNMYVGSDISFTSSEGKIVCVISELTLLPGTYSATIFCSASGERQDVVYNAISFEVLPQDVFGSGKLMDLSKQGVFYIKQKWELK